MEDTASRSDLLVSAVIARQLRAAYPNMVHASAPVRLAQLLR
jgi:hypothetical protein